ncbi:uncharacterized protein B0H18DRAFT_819416, partial [Fomitopsis serialis]
LHETFKVVDKLMSQLGFHWDTKSGTTINERSEPTWQAYIKKNPAAAAFRNKGWDYYDLVVQIM